VFRPTVRWGERGGGHRRLNPRADRSVLDERTIPIRLATHTPGGGLWMLSLWYRCRDGRLECVTGASATVVEYLREDPEVAFETSTNDLPYRGVRGAGTTSIAPDEDKTVPVRSSNGPSATRTPSWRTISSPRTGTKYGSPSTSSVRTRWDFSDRMGDGD